MEKECERGFVTVIKFAFLLLHTHTSNTHTRNTSGLGWISFNFTLSFRGFLYKNVFFSLQEKSLSSQARIISFKCFSPFLVYVTTSMFDGWDKKEGEEEEEERLVINEDKANKQLH